MSAEIINLAAKKEAKRRRGKKVAPRLTDDPKMKKALSLLALALPFDLFGAVLEVVRKFDNAGRARP